MNHSASASAAGSVLLLQDRRYICHGSDGNSSVQESLRAVMAGTGGTSVSYKFSILFCTLLFGSVAASTLDEASFEAESLPGEVTAAGQILRNALWPSR